MTATLRFEPPQSPAPTNSPHPRGLSPVPAPDLRPMPVRWHRTPTPGPDMSPLPLHADDLGSRPPVPRGVPLPGTDLEAVRTHARSLLVALVDAIQGRRPAAQLTRWVSDAVMAELTFRARLHQRAPRPLAVRSVRVQEIAPGVVELAARLQAGDRFEAAALRLERVGARWFCPVVDFGPLPRELAEGRSRSGQRRLYT